MIVIKTMTNLPEHCYDCPCHDGESGYCQADEEHRYSDWRPFWCPLASVEVNEEHNFRAGINTALNMIDKYKTESEDKDDKT